MKKVCCLILALAAALTCTSCAVFGGNDSPDMEPQVSQMKAICELAVMDCYYHNVAKFTEEDAQGILLWKKDKHFWIEYSGVVTLGIDASLLNIEIDDTNVTITLPEARVLSCKVDSEPLTEESYIVAKDSADIEAFDEVAAFDAAQKQLEETASGDKALLADAQQRAQNLLEDYISNIGSAVGKEYTVSWIYTDADGNTVGTSAAASAVESAVSSDNTQ